MKFKLYVVMTLVGVGIGIFGFKYLDTKFNNQVIKEEKVVETVKVIEENDLSKAIEKIYDATVLIESYSKNQKIGTGTGFVYKKDDKYGYLITNHHVISGSDVIKIVDNFNNSFEAKLLGSDEYSDIAVLSIDSKNVTKVATIGNSTDLKIGNTLFTVGSPLGSSYIGTVTKGILSGKDRTISVGQSNNSYIMEVLQTDAAINPGNSGGPLVNISGQVIGVNSLKLVEDKIEGMGFAIPIEIVMSSVDFLEKGKKIERPVVGIEVIDVNNKYGLYLNEIQVSKNITKGLVITKLEKDYPAEISGLKVGDVIIKIGNKEINDMAEFRFNLFKAKIGENIDVTYIRADKENTVKLLLDKKL